ncbi:dihydrofolate reductase [Paenibacillus sp. SC116]|uniref:dihydrofolate reductase n=1 Tax=Paenibacillus sp. SC116 TaxID=2968986 RepID=UPI00215A1AD3|nr:dihydrofolate reductase [Paenibacillus sp. SC116]MCR8842784.1 dihydrofolate reductase [Paenibacillus sp. SC116]
MSINMIWAMDRNNLIGRDNALPWHLPNDMKYFRRVTSGKTVVMGRKTYDSIGRPLPNRRNLVLTRNAKWSAEGAETITDLEVVLKLAEQEEVMIMGGAEIYHLFMPHADRLLITFIDAEYEGTDYFPNFEQTDWLLVEETEGTVDEKNPVPHRFSVYERNK